MQEHSIPVGNLIFPVLLPLGEGKLLKETVCVYYQHRGGGLETDTSFNAYYGIAYMTVTAYGICSANLLNLLNGFYAVIILFTVDGNQLTFLESQTQDLGALFGGMLKVSVLRKALLAVKQLAAAD
ncbi:MAG: hypothetical protein BWY95_01970 [Bacteroidetes bacterium ADurb.BinA104]|nr:MAG: hypothetical protein BWY95_01970 [Bacteroidetes bacterium ADurb.BinA104]